MLPNCRFGCSLTDLAVTRTVGGVSDLRGSLTVTGLAVRSAAGQWSALPAALTSTGAWRATAASGAGYRSSAAPRGSGLAYDFVLPWETAPALRPYAMPAQLPVVPTAGASVGAGSQKVSGVDRQQVPVSVQAAAAVLPRAGRDGLLVDRSLLLRVALDEVGEGVQEVWLAPGADPAIMARLDKAGVSVATDQSLSSVEASLGRQGPPLALLLFVVGAVVAAVLALAGTGLTLYFGGRRRGFELAALGALGVRVRALWASVALEQLVLLGFGVGLGVVTGLVSVHLAVPHVPEFSDPPAAPDLIYAPPYGRVVLLTLGLGAAVAVAVVLAAGTLVRRADPQLLREAAP